MLVSYVFPTLLIAVHFFLYVFIFRNQIYFQSEKGIFIYFLILVFITSGIYYLTPNIFDFYDFMFTSSVVGIYCISFLELWSLAQGGYSLSILNRVSGLNMWTSSLNFNDLEKIGEEKLKNRTQALEIAGLILKINEVNQLTPRGELIAKILQFIRIWVSQK